MNIMKSCGTPQGLQWQKKVQTNHFNLLQGVSMALHENNYNVFSNHPLKTMKLFIPL